MTAVNHAAVQRAQRVVGDRLEAERLERLSRRQPRRYGPHDDATAPQTVEVYGAGKYPQLVERPVPEAVLKQRRRINTIAHTPDVPAAAPAQVDATAANAALIDRLRGKPNHTPKGTP